MSQNTIGQIIVISKQLHQKMQTKLYIKMEPLMFTLQFILTHQQKKFIQNGDIMEYTSTQEDIVHMMLLHMFLIKNRDKRSCRTVGLKS